VPLFAGGGAGAVLLLIALAALVLLRHRRHRQGKTPLVAAAGGCGDVGAAGALTLSVAKFSVSNPLVAQRAPVPPPPATAPPPWAFISFVGYESSGAAPGAPAAKSPDTGAALVAAQAPLEAETPSHDSFVVVKPLRERPLPPGWSKKTSKSSGKVYFVSESGATSWDFPAAPSN
jgi:hypothetical protein